MFPLEVGDAAAFPCVTDAWRLAIPTITHRSVHHRYRRLRMRSSVNMHISDSSNATGARDRRAQQGHDGVKIKAIYRDPNRSSRCNKSGLAEHAAAQ
jgi:hypothetical protein